MQVRFGYNGFEHQGSSNHRDDAVALAKRLQGELSSARYAIAPDGNEIVGADSFGVFRNAQGHHAVIANTNRSDAYTRAKANPDLTELKRSEWEA